MSRRLGRMRRSARRNKLEQELFYVDGIEQMLRGKRGSQTAIALALGMKIGLARALDGDRYLPSFGEGSAFDRLRTMGVRGTFCILRADTVFSCLPKPRHRSRS